MSALLDLLSSALAWLMAIAMVHFGVIDTPVADPAPPAVQAAQSHSESAVANDNRTSSPPADDNDHARRRDT